MDVKHAEKQKKNKRNDRLAKKSITYCAPFFVLSLLIYFPTVMFQTKYSLLFDSYKTELWNMSTWTITFPEQTKTVHINIGPNLSPILPPEDKSVVVLAIEANTAIANRLREDYQKKYPNRFFVINVAVSGPPLAGTIGKFTFYNNGGQSSSLSKAVINSSWADTDKFNPTGSVGPGAAGFDFVGVLSLQSILSVIPKNIVIDLLKTDTQGHDFAVIRSAVPAQLRRVKRIITETYMNGIGKHRYKGVTNDLEKDWVPYMSSIGFFLSNPPEKSQMMEYDALWMQQ